MAGKAAPTISTRVLIVACLSVFLDATLVSVVTPLLPRLGEEFTLSPGELGLLAAAHPVGFVLAAPPAGAVVARSGARTAVLGAAVLMGVSCLLLASADGAALFAVGRLLQGAAGSFAWAGSFSWVAEMVPAGRRGQRIGTVLAASVAGGLLGPALAAAGEIVSPRGIFAALVIPAVILCWGALRLPQPVPRRGPGLAAVVREFRHLPVLLGVWLMAVVGLNNGMVTVLGTWRLDAGGVSTGAIAVVYMVAAGCQIVISPLIGRLTDRRGPALPAILSLLAVLTGLLSLINGPATTVVNAAAVLACLAGAAALSSPAMTMVSDGATAIDLPQGLVFALVNMVWALGSATGAAGSGLIAAGGAGALSTASVAVVIGLSLVALIMRCDRLRRSE